MSARMEGQTWPEARQTAVAFHEWARARWAAMTESQRCQMRQSARDWCAAQGSDYFDSTAPDDAAYQVNQRIVCGCLWPEFIDGRPELVGISVEPPSQLGFAIYALLLDTDIKRVGIADRRWLLAGLDDPTGPAAKRHSSASGRAA